MRYNARHTGRGLVICLMAVILSGTGVPAVFADATPNPQPARHDGSTPVGITAQAMPPAIATITLPPTTVATTGTPATPAPTVTAATHTPTVTASPSTTPTSVTSAATITTTATPTATVTSHSVPGGRQPSSRPPKVATPNPLPPTHPLGTPTGTPQVAPSPHPALPYRDANFLRGINYISYSTNGDGYTKYDQIASNIAPSGANWVAIVPSCYQDTNTSTTISCDAAVNDSGGNGYTPTDADVTLAITRAHAAGLKVMLKPQIEVRNGYRGQIGFGTGAGSEANWAAWFNNYRAAVIGRYAPIAQNFNVEAFVVGTELTDTNTDPACDPGISAQRGANWTAVVTFLRTLYSHKDGSGHELTKIMYAANWGTYDCAEVKSVNWWGSLDYIGVDAYYPLIVAPNGTFDPTIAPPFADLVAGWTDDNAPVNVGNGGIAPTTSLAAISAANGNKKVLLTEVGYQSMHGTTQQPYGIYVSPDPPFSFGEQALAFRATFEALAG